MAGVALSAEVWRFDAAAFCRGRCGTCSISGWNSVAGVAFCRGRRGAFSITGWICVAGVALAVPA